MAARTVKGDLGGGVHLEQAAREDGGGRKVLQLVELRHRAAQRQHHVPGLRAGASKREAVTHPFFCSEVDGMAAGPKLGHGAVALLETGTTRDCMHPDEPLMSQGCAQTQPRRHAWQRAALHRQAAWRPWAVRGCSMHAAGGPAAWRA